MSRVNTQAYPMRRTPVVVSLCAVAWAGNSLTPNALASQAPRALLPIEYENSAEFGWLRKPVIASRVLDDMTQPRDVALHRHRTANVSGRATSGGHARAAG